MRLDLFYHKHTIKALELAYEENKTINKSLIHLIRLLYQTYYINKSNTSLNNLEYALRSLSSSKEINDILKTPGICNSDSNSIYSNISKFLHYFNTEYIIRRASSLPLEFKEKRIMKGLKAPAYSLYELSNSLLLSGADDHTLRLWDLNTYQNVTTLRGHTASVFGIQEMIDGRLASCSEDTNIIIWSKFPYKYQCTLIGHSDNVNSIIQIKDTRLVTGSDDSTIRIWTVLSSSSLSDSSLIETLFPNQGPVSLVSELFDGRIIGLHINGKITIWDLLSLTNYFTLGNSNIETGLWFALQLKNNKDLIAVYDNQTISVWDLNTYKSTNTIQNTQTEVFSLFEMEDDVIASVSPNSIAVFNTIEGNCIRTYDETTIKDATFSIRLNDGRIVFSSMDNNIYVLS